MLSSISAMHHLSFTRASQLATYVVVWTLADTQFLARARASRHRLCDQGYTVYVSPEKRDLSIIVIIFAGYNEELCVVLLLF